MGWGTFLLAMVTPLLGRILIALGFSVVSIVGVTTVLAGLQAQLLSAANAVPAAGLQLALLAGCGTGFGIILGAIATRLVIWQAINATKILGVA